MTSRRAFRGGRVRRAVIVAAVLAATASPRANACDYGSSPLVVDSSKTGAAPGPIAGVTLTVQRGRGPRGSCGHSTATSCDDAGTIGLHFTAATDPDNGVKEVGYRISVTGSPPVGLDGLDAPQVGYFESGNDREATLWLHWSDGATDSQESIGFAVTLTPVDIHGNEGPPSAPIEIRDEGGGGGCAVGPWRGQRQGGVLAALSALGAVLLTASRLRGASARRRTRTP